MAVQASCSYGSNLACVKCYVFVPTFLFNAHFDLEPDYIIRKPIVHRIQWCILQMRKNARNHARNSPFPLRHVDFNLTHECLGPPHSSGQTTARLLYALPHNDTTKSPLVIMGRCKFTPQNCPFPFDNHHQNLIHPYQAWPHSPPQTASGSNHPCCHCSHVRTDRWATWMFSNISTPLAMLIESNVLITEQNSRSSPGWSHDQHQYSLLLSTKW